MREILFRAKRVDNGAWETGFLVITRVHCHDASFYITDKMTGYLTPVIPKTVGEFTGLCDKNGKKIFEGDILCVLEKITCVSPAVETKLNYEVIYNDGSFKTKGNEDADFTMDDMPLQYLQFVSEKHNNLVEVIGNVHDNKELLEVEE